MKKNILFGLFAVLSLLTFTSSASANTGHYRIDFGDANITTTETGWNNSHIGHYNYSLVDSAGESTPVTISIVSGTPSQNTAGNNSVGVYPVTAMQDSLYTSTAGFAGTSNSITYAISNLPSGVYDLKFFASRMGVSDVRSADYTAGGSTVSLNASNNSSSTATIYGVTPVNGQIQFTHQKSSSNTNPDGFSYLGVVEIMKQGSVQGGINVPPVVNAGADQTITLPNHTVSLDGTETDSDGTIVSRGWREITTGQALIVSPTGEDTQVTDLGPGLYTFEFTAVDNNGAITTDTVNVTVAPSPALSQARKIVVLGSSTAASWGASTYWNGWVGRMTTYLTSQNPNSEVVNLAVGGYSSYNLMPTGFIPPSGRPNPDTTKNITTAVNHEPDLIIVNLPSNDAGGLYTLTETQNNFRAIAAEAQKKGIPIWFTTTQPRNYSAPLIAIQIQTRDWILSNFAPRTVDFWTRVAAADGRISTVYDSGDGIHLKDVGHQLLFNRAVGSGFLEDAFVAPTISNLSLKMGDTVAKISWQTNELATTKVQYSKSSTNLNAQSVNNTLVSNHSASIKGLQACTRYYFRVVSEDVSGNIAQSEIGNFKTACTRDGVSTTFKISGGSTPTTVNSQPNRQ